MKKRSQLTAVILLLFGIAFAGCAGERRVLPVTERTVPTEAVTVPDVAGEQAETSKEVPTTEPIATPTVTITPTPTAAPTPTRAPELSLVMVGDVLLHTRVQESCHEEDGSYDYSVLFAQVEEEIRQADLALVNQEVIIGGAELGISGYPQFNAAYELGTALTEAGFDMVCHATNHALDQHRQGLLNCLRFWKTNYPEMMILGISETQEERSRITIYEKAGIRVAVLNYTYGTNGIPLPEDMPYGVHLLEEETVTEELRRAKALADFVIVCPHWGTEYRLEPDKNQKKWAELFLREGVDLVIGTHPHVIEPIVWMENEETGERMLVYYSLGNFVNWTSGKGVGVADRMIGGMAQVTIGRNEAGEAVITGYGIRALVTQVEYGYHGVTTYFLSDYPEELARRNEIVKQDASFDPEYGRALCEKVWGAVDFFEKRY